jgi:hypothetical protein
MGLSGRPYLEKWAPHLLEQYDARVLAEANDENVAKLMEAERAKVEICGHTKLQAKLPENNGHAISFIRATDISDDIPTWVWHYNDKGRIQLATLSLFAGRPGAGKSTAARYFTAGYTKGTISGTWEGKPQSVCYIASEESREYIIKPGLRAVDADLSRVYFPQVTFSGSDDVPVLATRDEQKLTNLLIAHDIRVVIVDPIMSTISSTTDVHRNNETRAALEPWSRIAQRIDGVVHGIVHLNKAPGGDVVAAINGSSAFGEIARSVFAFAKDPESEDGHRVMSQEKNNAGEEDLALVYDIEKQIVRTDSSRTAEVARFVIVGESDRTVGDVLRDTSRSGGRRPGRPMSDRTQEVLACARAMDDVTAVALAERLKMHRKEVSVYLYRLVDYGQLYRSPKRGHYQHNPPEEV